MLNKAEYPPEFESFLRESFAYDPDTGDIIQLIERKRGNQVKSPKGVRKQVINHSGYAIVPIKWGPRNRLVKAHRLAFFLKEGRWPHVIDHINHNRADNRWCNLREVSSSLNSHNRGVSWGKNSHLPVGIYDVVKNGYRTYKAGIKWNGRSLNTYRKSLEDAVAWRENKIRELGIGLA